MVRIPLTMPYFSSGYDQRSVRLKNSEKHIKYGDMVCATFIKNVIISLSRLLYKILTYIHNVN